MSTNGGPVPGADDEGAAAAPAEVMPTKESAARADVIPRLERVM
jgi:hypothetical protein